MDRRTFLGGATAAALAFPLAAAAETPITLHLPSPSSFGPAMPPDFLGLSYEGGQLYNAEFFSPRNVPLIETFRGIGSQGVLRLGGHLSNVTKWEGVGQDDPKQVRGVRHGIEDYWEWPLVDPTVQASKGGIITHKAIANLRGFLDAVNWRLLYGFNFACGSAARAADEAAVVSRVMGERLIAFVIGNEPEGFGDDPFFRAKGYGFEQYLAEYREWVKTIRQRVPQARFAGPDTEGKIDSWVRPFAEKTKGDLALLTSHYYGMGPASDPSMTAERLLRREHSQLEAEIAGIQAARAAAGGVRYRMDEGNSCFGGGRPGVSDAYASALWAADYLLTAACAGFAGVNLHGGGTGIYTPIESSAKAPAAPRPVYHGMQLAQQFVGCRVARCGVTTEANVTAYQGSRKGATLLALINKGKSAVPVELPGTMQAGGKFEGWELRGPALEAKSGVHFGPVPMNSGAKQVVVEAYSAKVLRVSA